MNWRDVLDRFAPVPESAPSAHARVEPAPIEPEMLTLRILTNRVVERARERRSVPHGRRF